MNIKEKIKVHQKPFKEELNSGFILMEKRLNESYIYYHRKDSDSVYEISVFNKYLIAQTLEEAIREKDFDRFTQLLLSTKMQLPSNENDIYRVKTLVYTESLKTILSEYILRATFDDMYIFTVQEEK